MHDVTEQLLPSVARFIEEPHGFFIDAEFSAGEAVCRSDVIDPARGVVISTAAEAGQSDVERAVQAAREALTRGPWSTMTPALRSRALNHLADLIESSIEPLAQVETLNAGMLLTDNRSMMIRVAAEQFRYAAGACTRLCGQTIPSSRAGTWHAYTTRDPVGVAALIVPWNAPLMLTAQKLAPALAAGCTVVLKPAQETPLSALWLGRLILDAGIPPGVVNIVTGGAAVGQALAEHPDIDKISFTGSTQTGRLVARAATGNLKRVTLELGGKSPVIVFPDADLDQAVAGAFGAIFRNAGQTCVAGSRLFVHRSVHDQVVEDIVRRTRAIKLGHGFDPASQMGPMVSARHRERVLGYISRGLDEGATLLTGRADEMSTMPGFFVEPTILADVSSDMTVMREEIFGPVLCVSRFDDDLQDIAKQANDSAFGLSASVWTRDLRTAHTMTRLLQSGMVSVNVHGGIDPAIPFGGVKQSGWGRECGDEGVLAYTEVKSVSICL
ncbi:aldehyde dehydrogenase family protein [Verticiella sediminum]|uniref:Aldehyde dehydrogenase family protein n=1 Tax=Verticiella sediminum TaxID=1247510 RepID=A0A556AIZ9_9BURK|nr:aldehyde dehydrogenase family protein [Verticiella sediminum]TSH92878.1 aldehyde dehydrogenase family protein [Verticiella sediminum]